MSVSTPVCRSSYTVAGSITTPLAIGFTYQNQSDIVVMKSASTGPVTLILNSDYSIDGLNNVVPIAGGAGNVILGDVLTILRNVPLTQLLDLTTNGLNSVANIGAALDKLTQITQEKSDADQRCLSVELDLGAQSLPPPATRKNQLVGFDTNGNFTIFSPAALASGTVVSGVAGQITVATATGIITVGLATIPTIAALTALTGINNQWFNVLGYRTPGDGGGGIFVFNSSSVAAADSGTIFAPNAGPGRFLRIYTGPLHAKWFGCYADNSHDDTAALQAAVTASGSNLLFLDPGSYVVSSTVNMVRGLRITGPTKRGTGTNPSPFGANLVAAFAGPVLSYAPGGATSCDIQLEHFQVSGDAGTYGSGDGIFFGVNTTDGKINDLVISAFGRYNINISGTSSFYLRDVYSANATTGNFYINAEYSTCDNCTSDGAQYSIYVAANADGARIKNCTLEGATVAHVYTVSGATDCCVEGCNLNITAGGYGINSNANRLRAVNNKIVTTVGGSAGILISPTSFENVVSGNFISIGGALSLGVDDEGGGLTEIVGNFISGGATGLKINPSLFPDTVTGNSVLGPTNSVLHVGGVAVYSGNYFDNGSGAYKAPTISAGTAQGLLQAWTPAATTVAITVNLAKYTKTGNLVTCHFDVTWPSNSDGNAAVLTGLPFAPVAAFSGGVALGLCEATTVKVAFCDTTKVNLYTDGITAATNTTMSTRRVVGTFSYFTA